MNDSGEVGVARIAAVAVAVDRRTYGRVPRRRRVFVRRQEHRLGGGDRHGSPLPVQVKRGASRGRRDNANRTLRPIKNCCGC